MSDPFRQAIPITDTVDLAVLGYEEGSRAYIIVNPTKALRQAWDGAADVPYTETGADGTTIALSDMERQQRLDAARYPLIPYVVTGLEFVRGGETVHFPILTAEDARRFDAEVDSNALNCALDEAFARGVERRLHAFRTFRGGH